MIYDGEQWNNTMLVAVETRRLLVTNAYRTTTSRDGSAVYTGSQFLGHQRCYPLGELGNPKVPLQGGARIFVRKPSQDLSVLLQGTGTQRDLP